MSAPALKTWADGDLVSASELNEQIKEQLANSFLHKATDAGSIPVSTGVRELEALPPPTNTGQHVLVSDGNGASPLWAPRTTYLLTVQGTNTQQTENTDWMNYEWLYIYDRRMRAGGFVKTQYVTASNSARLMFDVLRGAQLNVFKRAEDDNRLSLSSSIREIETIYLYAAGVNHWNVLKYGSDYDRRIHADVFGVR